MLTKCWLLLPVLSLVCISVWYGSSHLGLFSDADLDGESRDQSISELSITIKSSPGFTGVLSGEPPQHIFHAHIVGKGKPKAPVTLFWTVYDADTQLILPQKVETVTDETGHFTVAGQPFALFSTTSGHVRSVHGSTGANANIQAWVGESRRECMSERAVGSNKVAVSGRILAAKGNTPGVGRTLTVSFDNLDKAKFTLDRKELVPQVLDFTVVATGPPRTMSNILWSLVEENWHGDTILVAERDLTVMLDTKGRGTSRGQCLLFATPSGEIASSDFSTGRQRTNALRVRVRQIQDRHAMRSQTMQMQCKP
jgi:hypothetical protein